MLILKETYLDSYINCPATNMPIYVRFIPVELYNYYNNNGYSCIFEEYNEQIKEDDDISK